MKVGIVQSHVGVIGGNDAILTELIQVLKRGNHQITLFTFSKPPKEKFTDIKIESKIPIHFPLLGLYKNWFMPKFDYSNCEIILSMTGFNVKCNCPLIIYDQNNLGREFNKTYVPVKYKKGFWRLYYLPYKKFNKNSINYKAKYISNSSYSAAMLNTVARNVHVIYPPVDIDSFYSANKETQICMIGRISPEKNLEFAIEVLNKIHHHSVIFGNVTNTNKPYYNKLKAMCESHVIIVANGSRVQLKELLAQSKIYFHTAEETFGISVVESIASGCIPIVPNNSAHPETVPPEELRYTQNNIDSAVSKLYNAVAGNYDHRIDYLKKHVTQFNPEIFEQKILELVN